MKKKWETTTYRAIVDGVIVVLWISTMVTCSNYRDETILLESRLDDNAAKIAKVEGLQSRVEAVERENSELREADRLTEMYGPDLWFYRAFDLQRQVGFTLNVGNCSGRPCYTIRVAGIEGSGGNPFIRLLLDGNLPSFQSQRGGVSLSMPARNGCRVAFHSAEDFFITIEEVGFETIRAGVGIRPGSVERGILLEGWTCPSS